MKSPFNTVVNDGAGPENHNGPKNKETKDALYVIMSLPGSCIGTEKIIVVLTRHLICSH